MLSCSYLNSYLNSNIKCISTTSHGVVGYASGVIFGLFVYNMFTDKWDKIVKPITYKKALLNKYTIIGLCSGVFVGYNKDKQ